MSFFSLLFSEIPGKTAKTLRPELYITKLSMINSGVSGQRVSFFHDKNTQKVWKKPPKIQQKFGLKIENYVLCYGSGLNTEDLPHLPNPKNLGDKQRTVKKTKENPSKRNSKETKPSMERRAGSRPRNWGQCSGQCGQCRPKDPGRFACLSRCLESSESSIDCF